MTNSDIDTDKGRLQNDAERPKELKKEALQELLIQSAVLQFTEHGYRADFDEISHRAGVAQSALYSVFESGERVLYEVAGEIFAEILRAAQELTPDDPTALRYGALVSIAMHMAHGTEQIRDAFVAAYTLPKVVKMLNIVTGNELERILAPCLSAAQSGEDLYELNAESGALFGRYIASPRAKGGGAKDANEIKEKISGFLNCVLPLYHVPHELQKRTLDLAVSDTTERAAADLMKRIQANAQAVLKKHKESAESTEREG